MKRLSALVYKEWRDQRALIFVALILVAALLVLARCLAGKRFDILLRVEYVYPAILGVLFVAIATESATRDAGTGVERTLFGLPASRPLVWSAKTVYCLLAFVGFVGFLQFAEVLLRGFEHTLGASLRIGLVHPMYFVGGLCAASACFASACVLKRSLPAAIVGLVAMGAVPLLAILLPVTRATEWIDLCLNSWKPAEIAGVGTIGFVLASLLAFCVRRSDRLGLRRAGAATLGTGMILGPALAVTAHRSAWALDIERGSPHATIARASPSPDGRFVAVEVEQEWTPRQEWLTLSGRNTGSRCRVRREVWILDRDSGTWNEIDDRYRSLAGEPAWDERGRLRALSLGGAFGEDPHRLESIDPHTHAVTSEVPSDLSASLGQWCSHSEVKGEDVLTWKSNKLQLRLPSGTASKCAREPGVVFHELDGFVVRHQLDPDCTTRLFAVGAPPGRTWTVTPDGSMLYDFFGRVLFDACDGHVVRAFDQTRGFYGRSSVPGRICWVWHAGDSFTILNEDGSETPLPIHSFAWQELGSDHLLRQDGHTIESMRIDGSERQVLYQAREP